MDQKKFSSFVKCILCNKKIGLISDLQNQLVRSNSDIGNIEVAVAQEVVNATTDETEAEASSPKLLSA